MSRIVVGVQFCTRFIGKVNKTEARLSFQERLPKPQHRIRPPVKHLFLTESGKYQLLKCSTFVTVFTKVGAGHGASATIAVEKPNTLSSLLARTDGKEQPPKHCIPLCLLNIKCQTGVQVQEHLCNVAVSLPTFEKNWNGC